MPNAIRGSLALGLAAFLLLGVTAARADVVYSFEQTGPTISTGSRYAPDGPVLNVVTSGSFTLDQSLVRSPYAIFATSQGVFGAAGLEAISFATTGPASLLTAGLADFTTPARPGSGRFYTISLTGIAGSLIPTGTISYNNSESDARLTIEADADRDGVATVRGTFNTDAGGACGWTGACSFSGTLTAVMMPNGQTPVPEPASAALFGVALLALRAVRRRR